LVGGCVHFPLSVVLRTDNLPFFFFSSSSSSLFYQYFVTSNEYEAVWISIILLNGAKSQITLTLIGLKSLRLFKQVSLQNLNTENCHPSLLLCFNFFFQMGRTYLLLSLIRGYFFMFSFGYSSNCCVSLFLVVLHPACQYYYYHCSTTTTTNVGVCEQQSISVSRVILVLFSVGDLNHQTMSVAHTGQGRKPLNT